MKRTQEAFAAEVYRRSETVIQEKKKRRRALLTTLPLAVCLLTVSTVVLPEWQSDRTTADTSVATEGDLLTGEDITYGDIVDGSATDDAGLQGGFTGLTDDIGGGTATSHSVEVRRADGQSRLCTDAAVIRRLEEQLPDEALDAALRGSALKGDGSATDDKHREERYTFVLTGESGERYSFSLSDNTLSVNNAEQVFEMAEDEAAALRQTLLNILADE